MKNITQSVLLLFLAIAIIGIGASCKKDSSVSSGEPSIKYVRITDPVSSDSLLIGAGQGALIAIVGENLQGTVEIWFNDQKASLTPAYINDKTILVRVPNPIPNVVTNTMKLVFANGKTLLYKFEVQISEPVISGMTSEYVATGDVATINGDFFYMPLTVTFAGGVKGENVSVTDKTIQVRVPAGTQPGQITIATNFGTTKSNFWFRDNRNIFISSDPFTGWWNANFVVTNPGPNDPPSINGNYIRVKQKIGGWQWTEVAGGPPSAMGAISKNIPDDAILNPSDYNLKFELNTKKPYNANVIKFTIGLNDFDNNNYQWKPPYDTKGQWQTVIIPFEQIVTSYGHTLQVNPNGYYTRLLFHGGGDLDADISMDNFRIVPKFLK